MVNNMEFVRPLLWWLFAAFLVMASLPALASGKSTADMTWDEIAAAIEAGEAKQLYGNTKKIEEAISDALIATEFCVGTTFYRSKAVLAIRALMKSGRYDEAYIKTMNTVMSNAVEDVVNRDGREVACEAFRQSRTIDPNPFLTWHRQP